ncbi:Postreplication repair E3 ubiquitin-protein ligase rad18 [Paramyrothecium foliicola]|nr:Postreplication repair E3 ubiquitin-protein ligase rad18 [Paramyrothecium foliicola]
MTKRLLALTYHVCETMTDDDVPDSTDWLSTPLSALAAVEAALRCQVCKDFFQTPVITTCCHTFCSICIRRALSSDGKCPLCRAPEQELRLRSNWSLEETVEAFVNARPATLALARSRIDSDQTIKRKAGVEPSEAQEEPHPKRVRKSARLSKQQLEAGPEVEVEVDEAEPDRISIPPPREDVIEVIDDEEYVPEPGLSPTLKHRTFDYANPTLQKMDSLLALRMKEWQVFTHLESCTGESTPQRASESKASPVLGQSQRQQQKQLDRLPALSYSILKDQSLRKKLAELGISNQGPRSLLERRHKEWITIWNANCDAAKPKRRSELLRDLDVWERTQGGRATTSGKSAQNAVLIKDKEFDGTAWANKHDSSFKDLIASARQSRAAAKNRPAEDEQTASKNALPQRQQVSHDDALAITNPQALSNANSETLPVADANAARSAADAPTRTQEVSEHVAKLQTSGMEAHKVAVDAVDYGRDHHRETGAEKLEDRGDGILPEKLGEDKPRVHSWQTMELLGLPSAKPPIFE